jgi:hypothetical protein
MAGSYPAAERRPGFFRLVWRAIRQVFHETTGAVFLLLALSWSGATYRLWRHGTNPWVLGACFAFILMLALFGLTSFRSARRVR